jgi:hypothetical protein
MSPSKLRLQDYQLQSDEGFRKDSQKICIRNTDGFCVYFQIYYCVFIAICKNLHIVHLLYLTVCQQYRVNIACFFCVLSLVGKYVVYCLNVGLIARKLLILYICNMMPLIKYKRIQNSVKFSSFQ